MALDLAVFDRDLVKVIADIPATMVWGSQSVSVMKSERTKEHDKQMEGYRVDYTLEVQGRVDSLTSGTLPNPGVKVAIDDTTYRISQTMTSLDGKMFTIQLTDGNQ